VFQPVSALISLLVLAGVPSLTFVAVGYIASFWDTGVPDQDLGGAVLAASVAVIVLACSVVLTILNYTWLRWW